MRQTERWWGRLVAMALTVPMAVALWATPVGAHDPIFIEEDQTSPDVGPYMPDGAISWALYGSVLEPGDTRGFEFDLRDGEQLFVSLLIPALEPELSLADDELPIVELEYPDGSSTTIGPEIREEFNDPFSQTSYLTLAEFREPAMEGRYRGLVVGSAPSRFTVAIGEREEFFTPTERSGDRPTSFPEIAAPLQAWYATPPGAEAPTDLGQGDAEIQLDRIEEAIDSGEATDSGGSPDGGNAAAPSEEALDETASDDDGSLGWVAPLVAVVVAVSAAGWLVIRRRSGRSSPGTTA